MPEACAVTMRKLARMTPEDRSIFGTVAMRLAAESRETFNRDFLRVQFVTYTRIINDANR